MGTKLTYRTVFISDLHLGTRGCHAADVARLLKRIRCDKLYLVGDVLDLWRLKKRWMWNDDHNDVVRRVLKIARRGTEVIFIPGNHDGAARQFIGLEFGGVQVRAHDVHRTCDDRALFVTHGDQFDLIIQYSPLLSMLGAAAYEWLIRLNVFYNRARAAVDLPYWSLSRYVKLRVKKACTYISRFEDAVASEARRRGVDGVVCGHIHQAEIREHDGVTYYNCGDWVESCTLLVEHRSGEMELLDGLSLLASLREHDRFQEEVDALDDPDDLPADTIDAIDAALHR